MRGLYHVTFALLGLFILAIVPAIAWAQSSSPNYRLEESYFGTGGEVDASSPNFRSRQSTGSLGVGTATSPNFTTVAGANTPSEPFLEMAIEGNDVNLGTLDPSTTSFASSQGGTCNCTFYVRSYLSSAYSVISASPSLTSENGDTIEPKTTQGAPSSSTSVEEFGFNLVANTVPATMGAFPANQPDSTFANGVAASGYQTPNQYKYDPGDVVASATGLSGNQGVGRTDYTISYIAKIANITEAGTYTMRHNLIVIATF